MAKKIIDKIKEIEADPALIRKVQREAIEIILDIVRTHPKWDQFIRNFVDNENPHQLARLKLQDDAGEDPYIKQTVAYLLSNPTCGMDTPMRLHENIDEKLDIDIPYDEADSESGKEASSPRQGYQTEDNEDADK